MHRLRSYAALFTLALPACGPDKGDTEGTDASTGTDQTTSSTGPGESTSLTESSTPTTSGMATTDESTTSETTMRVTTTETTSTTTTTGTTTSTTTTTGETTGETTTGESTGESTGETTGGDACLACEVILPVDQSATMVPVPGNTLLGTVLEQGAIVWGIDTFEAGRVAYSCSDEVLNNEVTQCGLWEWLAGTEEPPRVLSTGNFICDDQPWNGFGKFDDFTYSESLPPEYVGDPAALHADFDVVVFCVSNFGGPPPIDAQTYIDYVKLGGGLYLTATQAFDDPSEDIDRINEIAVPLGVEFQPQNLNWDDPASGEFECFPEQTQP